VSADHTRVQKLPLLPQTRRRPYFTNLYFQSFRPATGKALPGEETTWRVVGRLCLAQCALGLWRLVLSPGMGVDGVPADLTPWYDRSRDWLEGRKLCSYRGSLHLAWSLPLAQPTYFVPGLGLHCFMMFAPILAIGGIRELDGCAFLFVSGPLLATWLTANRHEAASIWCFFSTLQCALGAISALVQSSRSSKTRKEA